MPRVVVLGCGTGVGKTRVSVALLRELARTRQPCAGLKPIESGIELYEASTLPRGPRPGSDAHALAQAGSLHVTTGPHPLYAFAQPISIHLASRHTGLEI